MNQSSLMLDGLPTPHRSMTRVDPVLRTAVRQRDYLRARGVVASCPLTAEPPSSSQVYSVAPADVDEMVYVMFYGGNNMGLARRQTRMAVKAVLMRCARTAEGMVQAPIALLSAILWALEDTIEAANADQPLH